MSAPADKVAFTFNRVILPGNPRPPIPSNEEISRILESNLTCPDILLISFHTLQAGFLTKLGRPCLKMTHEPDPFTDTPPAMTHGFLGYKFNP